MDGSPHDTKPTVLTSRTISGRPSFGSVPSGKGGVQNQTQLHPKNAGGAAPRQIGLLQDDAALYARGGSEKRRCTLGLGEVVRSRALRQLAFRLVRAEHARSVGSRRHASVRFRPTGEQREEATSWTFRGEDPSAKPAGGRIPISPRALNINAAPI